MDLFLKAHGANTMYLYQLAFQSSTWRLFTMKRFDDFLLILSLGTKDSWGPLKALVAASAVNGHLSCSPV